MKRARFPVVLGCSLLAVVTATTALAQGNAASPDALPNGPVADNEIIVTAQRRAERLQDVPITITSLSGATLERANVTELADIVKLTPAIRFDYQGNFVQPTIRGVGNAVVTTGGGSNVGIYVDGFYSPNPLAGDFQLLNLEGIQVLKGPQGTLFGRNTTGGAILVTTSEPSFATRGSAKATYGSFNTAEVSAYASTSLTEKIAFDIAGGDQRSDGYAVNIVPGPKHPGRYENWSVRAGLKFDVSDHVSFLARYTHQQLDDARQSALGILVQDGVNYAPRIFVADPANPGSVISAAIPSALVPTGFRQTAVNPGDDPGFEFSSDVFQLTGKFDLGFADLTSYSQYRREVGSTYTDQDQTALDLSFNLIPVTDKTFTQEFLLNSKPGGRLQWTAGVFYFNYVDTFLNDDGPVTGAGNKQFNPIFYQIITSARTQSLAGYADATYELADGLFITGGARYTYDKFDRVTAQFPPGPAFAQPSVSRGNITPRAVIRYKLAGSSSVYASFTKGYKAPLTDVLSGNIVNPEKMNAFEIGFKHATSDFSFNISSWYYKYRDLQVSVYENGLSRVLNAANAEIYGVEGDLRYSVTPDFEVKASAAYVHAKYTSFPSAAEYTLCSSVAPIAQCQANGFDSYLLTPFDASGGQMQRAPKFTATLGASYGIDVGNGRATLSGNYYRTSKFYFDLAQQFHENGYNLVGLRAEWTDRSNRLTAAVYGENVLNEKYYAQILAHGTGIGTVWGAPATVGVSLAYRFD